ncbi:MAG TPA: alpha-ketoglutarate-dependent dioxygenase AlkB [Chitinophagales bacterium]|nr:alpha-ketoglutarate-dependent dioxygenase AlkB [Chitinophagales bacterium]
MLKEIAKDDTILYVIPSKEKSCQTIYLTKSKSAWVTIKWLSDELINYSQNQYRSLFNLHPNERGKVVMHDEEVQSPRWHKSYMHTPMLNLIHAKKSYMYSGKELIGNDLSLPNLFQPFLDFINKTERNDQYNQVIVNWYLNGQDYIAAHSDCQIDMKPNAEISIITLCEQEEHFRELRFTPKKINGTENDAIYNHVKIATIHGSIITMHGDTQNKFRHKIPKALDIDTSRISITCRKF